MKKNIFIFSITILFFIGYGGCGIIFPKWDYYYPYSKINPEHLYKNLPTDYDDCLNQFDNILSNEIINHYQSLDSTIAAIEISQEIGGFFINFWNLSFYLKKPQTGGFIYSKRFGFKPLVLDEFIKDGINDPEAMVRILFNSYHKKLTNIPYNWEEEIQLLKSYWIPSKYGEGWVSKEMIKRENEILIEFHFQQLAVNDTVDILYNRSPRLIKRTPDWYYLTGIIQFKIPEQKAINVKLIDIQSDLKKNYMIIEKDTIAVGDTLTDYSKGWLKRGIYYMDYNRNIEYRQRFEKE